jgi:hypothetical protein
MGNYFPLVGVILSEGTIGHGGSDLIRGEELAFGWCDHIIGNYCTPESKSSNVHVIYATSIQDNNLFRNNCTCDP